ncbi:MAG: hypothetical protein HFJ27_04965 [Clostridia bacterium]|nr:hypothetical protein [Clostridia bacterium]
MILETKTKTINLVLKTKKIVEITNTLKNKNFEEVYFKAVQNNDLNALSKIIYTLAEDNEGKHSFNNSEEVYDFIDEYKKEKGKTYQKIFEELTEVINEEGFFTNKMTKKQLTEMISNPLSGTNMNELVQKSAERAISKMAEEQFQGFKA